MKPPNPIDPADLPERVWEVLQPPSPARSLAYNRYGTLLAVGCEDGRVCVFDIDTSGIARSWRPHAAPVTCLAWSRDGKRVASGAMDRTLALGDVFGASVVSASADLGGTVVAVSLGAAGPDTAVASFPSGPPRLVRLAAAGDAGTVLAIPPLAAPAGPGGRGGSVLTAAAVADPARGVVFVGQARGLLSVIHAPTGRVLDVIKCPGAPRAQALALGCGGGGRGAHRLIVTCHDRAVRLYDLAPVQTFKEAVVGAGAGAVVGLDGSPGLTAAAAGEAIAGAGKNPAPGSLLRREAPLATLTAELCQAVDRSAWRGASLSDDGTWVAAAVQSRDAHAVFVWPAREAAAANRVLTGPPRDAALAAAWRPRGEGDLATIASTSGTVLIWSRTSREQWAAFAPGFRELAENEVYVEREDEFDVDAAPGPGGLLPGGVRLTGAGLADDSGTSADIDLPNAVPARSDVSTATDGTECLVRLPPEVWRDCDPRLAESRPPAPGAGPSESAAPSVGASGEPSPRPPKRQK